jgi:hypothetical protein
VIPALALALATLVGTGALASSGDYLLSFLVFVVGMAMAVAVLLISDAIALARSVWEWVRLIRAKPEHVKVVSVHPPKGFLFRRQAVVELDVRTEDGTLTRQEQEIPIPRLQAFLWRVVGRVPTPIGRLTDQRDLNATVWGKEAEPTPAQAAAEAPGTPADRQSLGA